MNKENGEGMVRKILFNEVTLFIAVAAFLWGVYSYINTPQNASTTAISLLEERVAAQSKTIDDITMIQQNDVKEVKSEIVGLRTEMQTLTNSIIKLQTIIEERIPKR